MPDASLEPPLDWDEIQGNVIPGFNKDHQTLLGFRFDGDMAASRRFVAQLADAITSLRAMTEHKRERRAFMLARDEEPASEAVWHAAAFSFKGLEKLGAAANAFTDPSFRSGLEHASVRLGDPPGSTAGWKVGGGAGVPDAIVTLASDHAHTVAARQRKLVASARASGVTLVYQEDGHDLAHYSDGTNDYPSGHEHFGFKDGISQPAVRGHLPDGTQLEPRASTPPASDESAPEFTANDRPLVCAGQFVFGYARQVDTFPRSAGRPHRLGAVERAVAPDWAANGSFLVFRRLRQYVAGFRAFAAASASAIGRPDVNAARVAAMIVGRWPSGAPLVRSPTQDDRAAAGELANAFAYGDDNARFGVPPDSDGVRCPVAAHVRKVNPRDENTDIGSAAATLTKRILRRGIPYGLPFEHAPDDGTDRGLLFMSYQTSIPDQFEFLATRWMNRPDLPRNPSDHPEGLGYDMVLGQEQDARLRTAYLRFPDAGGLADVEIGNAGLAVQDWVAATGGGYFFAPSISAMRTVLGAPG